MKQAWIAAFLLATPAVGQGVPPLNQLIDESIGYVSIAPGLLLIEDNQSSTICRIDVGADYFAAYAAGENPGEANVICVPTPVLATAAPKLANTVAFDEMIDTSIGYVTVGPGQLLIEDSVSSNICHVDVPDAFFTAYATGDSDLLASSAPSIICVPTPEFQK